MYRLGLIGAGRIGIIHGLNAVAHPKAQLVALTDADPVAADSLAARTGAAVRTTEEIIASPDIDAILICSPTDTHSDLIEQSARAGKAIFCEKPIDLSVERAARAVAVAEEAKVPLMIAFQRRFDPHLSTLQRQLRDGVIGQTEIITIMSRDPAPPPVSYIKRSGGLYRDAMIHDFDEARFLLGEEPVEVFALGSCMVDPAIGEAGDVDTAAVLLRTASGAICQISVSRRATYGHDQRVEVLGSKGLLRTGNIHETTVEHASSSGFLQAPVLNFFLERYAAAYKIELDAFLEHLEKGTSPTPTGYDGLMALRIADAATKSRETGLPVRVQA
ncbi:inositol 2-dehydrogenase [Paraburkholderia bannensis]|uniref:inositol 2-dehydrogenase n=1 Tax=Paraburkholderia bannensis TaxID=765414 RepID=UPI002AC356FC|nr:inositol 2-dehydrogenase [Paraburkholderia bannensis]